MKEIIIAYEDSESSPIMGEWVGELVRCKDCKNYNTENCADGFGWCNRNGTGHGSTDDWFCANGELKE